VSRQRWFLDSPFRLGLVLATLLIAGFLVWETVFDRWPGILYSARTGLIGQPSGPLRDFRIAILHCLLVGYLPAAFLAVVRGGRKTVRELQGALDCTPEECDALAVSLRLPVRGLVGAVLIGLVLALGTPYLASPVPDDLWNPVTWSAEVVWHRVLGPLVAVGSVALVYAILVVSGRMSRLAEDLKSIDLFDLRPLYPFTQLGLTNALLLMGLVAIAGLMVLTESGFGLLGLLVGTAILTAAGLAVAFPLRGVHRRITQAKAAELEWVEAKLGEQRTVLKTGADRTSGDLSDLAAYRDLVRSVRDWPITTSSYVRFALYLLIPVASWAAAALVERVVDAWIS
jgi:hypothetical protein